MSYDVLFLGDNEATNNYPEQKKTKLRVVCKCLVGINGQHQRLALPTVAKVGITWRNLALFFGSSCALQVQVFDILNDSSVNLHLVSASCKAFSNIISSNINLYQKSFLDFLSTQ